MNHILEEKLNRDSVTYEQAEIDWLLENIGNENSEIRDDLVFESLANGILNHYFSLAQFQYIAQASMETNGQLFELEKSGKASLTRTFSALLNGYLIKGDGENAGKYEGSLSSEQREYLFETVLSYLHLEQDFTGFSEEFGWVHGFAHDADALASAMQHPDFSEKQALRALDEMAALFHRLPEPFSHNEERRLAQVFVAALRNKKLSQSQIALWISNLKFSQDELIERRRMWNFMSLLATVYFHTLDDIEPSSQLSTVLISILRER
ncbi:MULTISPECIES: DUF2785 domain-containing protein [unclassified Lactococcus]|uniref:DUF2785 domain-containing protein n=1 Tax=unclassified Lactococcus TaxID=2643510 RepID=UPI0011C9907F|nr:MULTISPECIES: DUF2785 domain-containing protein [unclassified Lactococcus]MQW23302.1 DUF2785 domain-containing protein [Lactococcus sp. dk101]TXK38032.1 DUF2785 domain-containing protein [Lactococcus sp. dk310]TXK49711.1 DUF2785 domain-containing protein [Lactococcus sp. dk322]